MVNRRRVRRFCLRCRRRDMFGVVRQKETFFRRRASSDRDEEARRANGLGLKGLELFRNGYPRLKAALYWHERWQNPDGFYSNLRVNSSVESLRAYRSGVAHPDWLGDLILRALPKTLR